MSLPLPSDTISVPKTTDTPIAIGRKPLNPELPLQVVFLLDITGSMSSQIEGVKSMVATFCSYDRPGINVHVWTYTEDTHTCYVCKSKPGLSEDDLVDYVFQIKLSCPPEFPNANAGGGDSPENVVAGVVSLLDSFDSQYNIVCFVITDAAPHHKTYGLSGEAKAEIEWLKAHGHQNTDIFVLLNQVIDELNVTFVPVLYSGIENNVWHQQAAFLTQGCVLVPNNANSEVLANGLGALLNSFQKISINKNASGIDSATFQVLTQGYTVVDIDPEKFETLETDPDVNANLSKNFPKLSDPEQIKASLVGLMETACDKFKGKKAGKRCRSINPKVISASIKVLVDSALNLINSSLFNGEDFNKNVAELIKEIEEGHAENFEYELKQLNKYIESLPSRKERLSSYLSSYDPSFQPIECLFLLESSLEYLSGLEAMPRTEEEISAWMEIVLKLTLCKLLQISFPIDATGAQDFKDAWSCSVRSIELSTVLSTFAAAKLRDPATCFYTDPTSGKQNNAAVILTHPNDPVLTEIYAALSSLPSLQGLIQGYLISGGLKIFPAIVPGIQASVLLFILRGACKELKLTQAEWEFVRCILWSIKNSNDTPAVQIVISLKNQKGLNPVDNISKLMAGIIGFINQNNSFLSGHENVFELFFKELSADCVANIYRIRQKNAENKEKADNDGFIKDEDINECFISSENIKEFDPISDFHDSEKINKKISNLPKSGFEKLNEIVSKTEAFNKTVSLFKMFCDVLEANPQVQDVNESFGSISRAYSESVNHDKLLEIFVESLLVKSRTSRYTLNEEKNWERSEKAINIEELCVESLSNAYRSWFITWNNIRKVHARDHLINQASKIEGETSEVCSEKLKELNLELLGVKYSISRPDVIDILKLITNKAHLPTLGLALCIGKWTTQPPAQLRRFIKFIEELFQEHSEIFKSIQQEIVKISGCARIKANRHGHHHLNHFPGLINWNQEYHDERLKNFTKKGKKVKILDEMKNFTNYATEVRENDFANLGENRKKLIDWVLNYAENPRELEKIKAIVEKIKSNEKIDDATRNETVDKKIFEISKVGKNNKKRPFARLTEFLSSVN